MIAKKKVNKRTILTDDDFKDAKIRITTFVNIEAVSAIRKEAEEKGLKYQTLINMILVEHAKNLSGKNVITPNFKQINHSKQLKNTDADITAILEKKLQPLAKQIDLLKHQVTALKKAK